MKFQEIRILAFGIVLGIMIAIPMFVFMQNIMPSKNLFKEYYDTENMVSMSPQDAISRLEKNDSSLIIVDLRTRNEYGNGHLITSINIPAAEMSSGQVVSAFSGLSKDKIVVTYCYSSYCMLSRNVGKLLSDNGIFVKHLTAGWYETNRDYSGYVTKGSDPGRFIISGSGAVCSIGELGC